MYLLERSWMVCLPVGETQPFSDGNDEMIEEGQGLDSGEICRYFLRVRQDVIGQKERIRRQFWQEEREL